jgi:hypothetical protein
MVETRSETIMRELKHHLPFTLTISLIAGVLVGIFYSSGKIPSEALFEFFHPAHVLVSAIATSAIYSKYKKSPLKSILIGMSGAIFIGSLSDVIFPFLAGNLFSLNTSFHLPIFEEPFLILGVSLFGAILGIYFNLFKVSHFLHIFLSIFASLFYLLAFSIELNAVGILLISGLVFLTVYIPCCISDIVFPILFLKRPCKDCGHWHEHD